MNIFDYASRSSDTIEGNGSKPSSLQTPSSIFDEAEKISLPEEESLGQAIPRHLGRSALALNEMGYGILGNLIEPVQEHAAGLLETVRGEPISENIRQKVSEQRKKFAPTSEELKQRNIKLFPEIRTPRSKTEEKFDQGIQDFASFMLFPHPEMGLLKNAARAAGLLGVGEVAREGTKQFGFGEDAQDRARSITMFAMGMVNPKGADRFADNLYKDARSNLPRGATANANKLEQQLKDLKKSVSKGTMSPDEKAVFDEANLILDKIKNGSIEYEELIASKISGNKKMKEFLYSTKDREAKAGARRRFKTINHDLNEALSQAKQPYPEFYKLQKMADEAYGAIQSSKKVSHWLQDNIGKSVLVGGSYPLHALFTGGPLAAMLSGGHLALGAGVLKSGELISRIYKSPVLREYYSKVLMDAARQNAESMQRNLIKLKKEMESDEDIMNILKSD